MNRESSKYEKLGRELEGFYTLESFAERLKIDKIRAIYVLYKLRKLGFVKTSYGEGKRRVYYISLRNKQRGVSYTEKINEALKNPALRVTTFDPYYVYGRNPRYEEVLIYAIKQRDVRYLIASLVLFRKISDWSYLYKLAKKEDLVREVAALYEIARKVIRKVRRMPRRFIGLARKKKRGKFYYIVEGVSSENFKDIEKKWRVYLPLNFSDLEEYKND